MSSELKSWQFLNVLEAVDIKSVVVLDLDTVSLLVAYKALTTITDYDRDA